ncbi:MAG: ShlB/FhaC/HecB family hemolysin secretion/activation protein [Gammaproteobacteria bacterium]
MKSARLAWACLPALLWALAAPAQDAPAVPVEQAAGEVRFDVWEYRVSGVSLVDSRAVERAVYPHLGPARTLGDVEAAALAIEGLYREAGFGATVYVNIPEQNVEEGLVLLDVTEGKVERLRVTGSRYFDLDRIKHKLPALAPGAVPHLPSMQEQLAALNAATVNRRVTPVLRPARSSGMVDVDLEVEDELPVHGGIEFNDQYVRDTTGTRLAGDIRYENLWQREHSIGFSFELTPEDPNEVRVLSGTYLMRPEDSEWLLAAYGVSSDSDVTTFAGDAGGGIGVLGKGFVIGARAIRPLPVVAGVISNLTLGLDYKDFDDEISIGDGGDTLLNPISYVKFVLGWGGLVSLDRSDFRFNADVHIGPRGLGNSDRVDAGGTTIPEFANKRAFARPNFVFLRATADYNRAWLWDSNLSLEFDAQLASVALVSNEQFSLGGVDTVRGYFEAQTLADNVVVLSAQWTSPSFHELAWGDFFRDARVFVFADGGRGMLIDPLPDNDAGFGLASLGFGLNAGGYGFDSLLTWAWPLIDAEGVDRYDPRFHFQVSYDF